jgi:hypothetical protein
MTLISPITSDPVRNWVAMNNNNCDEIDAVIGPNTVQSYVPGFMGTGSTQPNLGNTGTITGVFYVQFETVFTWGFFRFGGSGINMGNGSFNITLPFICDASMQEDPDSGHGAIIGNAVCRDESSTANRQTCVVQLTGGNVVIFDLQAGGASSRAAGGAGGGRPFAWADGDAIHWAASYKIGV